MDFDQLETFLEVARHASFSRAAEKRFRTQPAISSQIRGIEEEVGAVRRASVDASRRADAERGVRSWSALQEVGEVFCRHDRLRLFL